MILTDACGDHKTTQWFLEGTQPTEICPVHSNTTNSTLARIRLEKEMYKSGQRFNLDFDTSPLTVNFDFLNDGYDFTNDNLDSTTLTDNNIEQETWAEEDYDYNYLME